MSIRICFFAALVFVLSGCSSDTSDADLHFIQTADARELIGGKNRLLGLGKESKAVWVDPRTKTAYQNGHIPGAIHVPYQDVAEQFRALEKFDAVIVYGVDFNDPKAEGMSKRLIELGLDDVRTLEGGLRAWENSGYELEKGAGRTVDDI